MKMEDEWLFSKLADSFHKKDVVSEIFCLKIKSGLNVKSENQLVIFVKNSL